MKPPGPSQTPPAPARIWVLLASESSKAVIFRRGPSRWTRLYLWNTYTDEITPGSWFAGRLYELMSDLSPDGEHLIYFARNEAKRREQAGRNQFSLDSFISWTALCRPPWVKAIGLWNASDGWSGGGVFAGNRKLWLYHSTFDEQAQIKPGGFKVEAQHEKERIGVFLASMLRNKWRISGSAEAVPPVRRKGLLLTKRKLALTMSYSSSHRLIKSYTWNDDATLLGGMSWADIDQQGRLVCAREGRLYAFVKDHEIELADLNLDQPPGRPEEKTTD